MTFGINGFDTLFIVIIAVAGFVFGAAACRDLEKYLK